MDRSKIYGIEFDPASPDPRADRIFDAKGAKNTWTVGPRFQNGRKNDFDEFYPWGEMKLCAVKITDGKKEVIYADDERFTRDGSVGNVMVEIPKFYSLRTRENGREKWLISGEKHDGFSLEPAFRRGNEERDFVYVAAYNTTTRENGLFSFTGEFPDWCKTIGTFEEEAMNSGYCPYDVAVHSMLQKLIIIEFATRDVRSALGGLQFFSYGGIARPGNAIVNISKNKIVLKNSGRLPNFAVGHTVGIGHEYHQKDLIRRTVTDIKLWNGDPDFVEISYDGEDVSDRISVGGDTAFGTVQKNGLSDSLSYHTGRTDMHCPFASEKEPLLNAFRYRFIENVWGNIWEFVSGLRIKSLRYYYTFEPEKYAEETDQWAKVEGFAGALQPWLADLHPENVWVTEMGFDPSCPDLVLPEKCGNGAKGLFNDCVFYSYYDKNYDGNPVDPEFTYTFCSGAGYDHIFGSLMTYRGFLSRRTANWLYGNRLVLR